MKSIPNIKPSDRRLAAARGDLLVVTDMDGHAEWFAVSDLRGERVYSGGRCVDYEGMELLRLNVQPDSMTGGVTDGD